MSDQFTAITIAVIVIWLAVTVAFVVVIAQMIRVDDARTAAGSGVPKTLEHWADPSAPIAITARGRRRAEGQRGAEPTEADGPSV